MQRNLAVLTIIFIAFLFSSFVYLIVGFALSQAHWKPIVADVNLRGTVFWLLTAVSVALLFVAIKLKSAFFEQRGSDLEVNPEERRRYVLSRYIVLFAIAEAPAILGLVYLTLSGNFVREVILCAISVLTFFVVKPGSESQAG